MKKVKEGIMGTQLSGDANSWPSDTTKAGIVSCRTEIWEHDGAFLGVVSNGEACGLKPSPIVLADTALAAEVKLWDTIDKAYTPD